MEAHARGRKQGAGARARGSGRGSGQGLPQGADRPSTPSRSGTAKCGGVEDVGILEGLDSRDHPTSVGRVHAVPVCESVEERASWETCIHRAPNHLHAPSFPPLATLLARRLTREALRRTLQNRPYPSYAPEGPTDVELASAVGVTKALIAKALKKLIADGFVEKLSGRPARYVATGGGES